MDRGLLMNTFSLSKGGKARATLWQKPEARLAFIHHMLKFINSKLCVLKTNSPLKHLQSFDHYIEVGVSTTLTVFQLWCNSL